MLGKELNSIGQEHTRIYIAISVYNRYNSTYRAFHHSVHSHDPWSWTTTALTGLWLGLLSKPTCMSCYKPISAVRAGFTLHEDYLMTDKPTTTALSALCWNYVGFLTPGPCLFIIGILL